jgi:hypothetical protein
MFLAALRALLIAASSAMVTLAQLNLPKNYWNKHSAWLYVATGTFSLMAFWEVVRNAVLSIQSDAVRAYEREIRGHLSEAMLSTKDKFPQADLMLVGVHAFRIRGIPPFRRLVNVGSLRLGTFPTLASPKWRRGKGVVGLAWESEHTIVEDWEVFF